jgi:hypothetical protein
VEEPILREPGAIIVDPGSGGDPGAFWRAVDRLASRGGNLRGRPARW